MVTDPIIAAYDKGYDARMSEQPKEANPYNPRTRRHRAWNDGWELADTVLKEADDE